MSISWRVRDIALGGGISVYPALRREKQAMKNGEPVASHVDVVVNFR
jgi:hypothetical protein